MRIFALLALAITSSYSFALAPGDISHGIILQYHHVSNETPPITSIPPDRFAKQLDWLASHNFEIWPLEKLVDYVREDKPTPQHVAAITFDDAYESIYTKAFPLLKKRGWPFTIFVATKYVGTSHHFYLSWQQLKEMQADGATIGNHTYDHTHLIRRLKGETKVAWHQRIEDEIDHAARMIQEHLGGTPKLFAYPYGEYDSDVIAIVDTLGYTGFGQQSGAIGPKSLFAVLPRFPMGGKYSQMDSFKVKAETLPMPIETVSIDPLVGTDLRPVLTLKFTSTDLRLNQLVCYGPDGITSLTRKSSDTFEVQSKAPIPVGRSRYNCTIPVEHSPRWYWFSQMWIRKEPDGSWYPEP